MVKRYLLVSDFDGTVANTFAKSPNGVNVDMAYEYAIKELFSKEGLMAYQEIGGLQNKAPEELVSDILRQTDNVKILNKNAEQCFLKHDKTLSRLVPKGKGSLLEQQLFTRGKESHRVMAEMLVLLKMSFLMSEIGVQHNDNTCWPEPCHGFINFYKFLEELNKDNDLDIQFAILSSGHDIFIQKTFELWGIKIPQIMVTDDDMRGASYPKSIRRRVKPSSYLFDLIQSQWLNSFMQLHNSAQLIEQVLHYRDRMVYFGDDSAKDGELARNARVPFFLLKNPTVESCCSYRWSEIQTLKFDQKCIDLMKKDTRFFQIFSNHM
ncbi:MAG: hypothetical protein U9M94_00940 [Patescibacteria group bacterium]|nr:hypothetical protein [Patescibacteria group bacterium]